MRIAHALAIACSTSCSRLNGKVTTEQLPFVSRYNGRKVFGNIRTSFEFLFEFNYELNSRKNSVQSALFSSLDSGKLYNSPLKELPDEVSLPLCILPLFAAELKYISFYLLSLVLFIVCHKSYDLLNISLCRACMCVWVCGKGENIRFRFIELMVVTGEFRKAELLTACNSDSKNVMQ